MSTGVWKAALTYAALVFGVGFCLGMVRILLVVPQFGVRTAELVEMPFMVTASVLAAGWVLRRFSLAVGRPSRALAAGSLALAVLLGAEVGIGAALRRASPLTVLLDHDPISGTAYYLSLLTFALLPWWLSRRSLPRPVGRRELAASVPPVLRK